MIVWENHRNVKLEEHIMHDSKLHDGELVGEETRKKGKRRGVEIILPPRRIISADTPEDDDPPPAPRHNYQED